MPTTEAGKRLLDVIARDKATFMPEVWNEIVAAIEAEAVTAAIGPFLRRTGGLVVRSEDGKEYLRVPSEWIDDLAAIAKAYREDTDDR